MGISWLNCWVISTIGSTYIPRNMRSITILILAVLITFEKGFAQEDELDALRKNIPGEPGKDYPIYSISILCKINPKNPGCGGGNGGGKGGKNGGGNGGKGGNNQPNGGNGNGG